MAADDMSVARRQWERYVYCRDAGHIEHIHKSRRCEDYFAGLQWDKNVLADLKDARRPGLTINKILGTMSSIMGEQIDLRSETIFRGKAGSRSGNADALTKVFKHISDKNQLAWRRSELFADGAITSRGYLDVRMNFDRSLTGDVAITNMNPRCVIVDPDAWEYDPDEWKDVITTRWLTPDDIELLYKFDAKKIRERAVASYSFGYDSIDTLRDRFGSEGPVGLAIPDEDDAVSRYIRVVDRQYRELTRVKYFVNMQTGDRKLIPDSWDRDKIALHLQVQSQGGVPVAVDETIGFRIRWTVTADDFVLHNRWSPYKHFTIIPYFPYLRYGRTIGLVENLLDPQDLLNKSTSQELHVVNTTANSGWKLKSGSLKNMSTDELEQHGSATGVVLELDDVKDAEKIQPNQIPQGLERLSMKGEGYIKSVSMRGDAQMGMTRADVSAAQIRENRLSSDVGLRKPLDNLNRSDHILARNVLDLIQEFYTDPRVMAITKDELTGDRVEVQINWPDPTTGELQNDVSLGEFDIVIVSQPAKQMLEDTQFEQIAYMREKLGIRIPDEHVIENSTLMNKSQIVQSIREEKTSEAAQMQRQIQLLGQQLELANLKADASKSEADAVLRRAKAASELAEIQAAAQGGETEAAKAEAEMALDERKHAQELRQKQEMHDQTLRHKEEMARIEAEGKKKLMEEEARLKRAQAIAAARQKPAAAGGSAAGTEKKAA